MVGMINCVVLEATTFCQTIGLLKPEIDTLFLRTLAYLW
jgi:hypothetical protein